jgi:prefoldin subunit 5
VQKIFIPVFLVFIGITLGGCTGTPAVNDDRYNENLDTLQRRITFLETRNQELETRISELIADSQRYADAYQSATASIRESIVVADGTAGSIEDRIDRLLSYNQLLTRIVQQCIDEESRSNYGEDGKE